jgi:hypothetical protein
MNIENKLLNKTSKERATIKGVEIARAFAIGEKTAGEYRIEVTEINPIEGGIEVFARAWRNGKQLAFGPDGTVDIERFRFINPPVMVGDGTYRKETFEGKEYDTPNHKIDPAAALMEILVDTVRRVGKSSTNMVPGKVGNTTSTFFASYGAIITEQTAEQTWDTMHDAATADTVITTDQRMCYYIGSGDISDRWNVLARSGFTFATATLPDTDAISSATLSLYGDGTTNNNTFTNGVVGGGNVYSFAPASATSFATSDFDDFGTTQFSTTIQQTSWNTGAYNDFPLNASGIAYIKKTDDTIFGVREANYDAPDTPPTWQAGCITRAGFRNYTASGTTNDPKLVVEHAAAAVNTGNFFHYF